MRACSILTSISAAGLAHATSLSPRAEREISVPSTKPDGAFVVPKNFVGFGIESAFFPHFNNDFSSNLVSSVAARMSEPPVMRVGGTSGDYFKFNATQEAATVCYDGKCGSHLGRYILGPSYFDAFREQFGDAEFIVQAPIGPVDEEDRLAYVKNAWDALGDGDRVDTIALGNEVEFIYKKGAEEYVDEALKLQEALIEELGLEDDDARVFESGNTASGTITEDKLYRA